ncbi:A1pp-domain-containing protein [Cucurbitaria berberidis CBS 394.84]|uniref:A1pp-domain-containing protein n=1 Tax=Cucurbitaria berberidis CBS 394.84 TaxID=1168544 RepID=A0A9P4GAT7_9PLEO|nr:A1pp-domain-containing protein [Cucurbitaria berberidis CBS 394.84]KAF1842373.1 A1pp-domain-containing protein [Cucurbitaria berberidis CBS 394.84]
MSLLHDTLLSLLRESKNPQVLHIEQHLPQYESWEKLHLLKQLLCIRAPSPPLSIQLVRDIDAVLIHARDQRILTLGSSIPPVATLQRPGKSDISIKLWQGDITCLASDVTVITNAANAQMLGCFQPSHKCIDNVIHSVAGPRLRQECFDIMTARGSDLPVGEALVTEGYCLPSPHVIHTVGPQLARGAVPTNEEMQQLRQCYVSVLDQAEGLPSNEDGSKRVALCGISTGLFAFPTKIAAKIAVETIMAWAVHNDNTSITEVLFVTFAEGDYDIYNALITQMHSKWPSILTNPSPTSNHSLPIEGKTLKIARQWLETADSIIISAGAGLSAADDLDYTSRALFAKHFPAFLKLGLTTLYSAIGFNDWPSDQDKWGYYFTNVQVVRSWPSWPLYQALIPWLQTFGDKAHVRTSNADGLFLANGWPEEKLSTPQGRYSVLQCLATCRPDSTFDTLPFYEAALPHLDTQTQRLTDPSKVPRCPHCGGDMMICVRGGDWFNERPFQAGEARWKDFRQRVRRSGGKTVVLELGVGMNTPGVLKWPDEDLVRNGDGQIKLIRVGIGPSVTMPSDLEEKGLAISIEGDIKLALPWILPDSLDETLAR